MKLHLPIPEGLEYASPDPVAPFFLAPNGEKPHETGRWITIDDENELSEFIRGEKAIILYGFLEYRDTIKKIDLHKTRFFMSWFYKDGAPTYSPVGAKSYIEYT